MTDIQRLDQSVFAWMHEEPAMGIPYSVVLADSHDMFRQEVRRIIETMGDIRVVGEAGDGYQLLDVLQSVIPDMVIVDISMPNLRDIEAISKIRALHANIKLLFISIHEHQEYLNYALDNGANGFICKLNLDNELWPAIGAIRCGNIYISPLVSQG
jgi:DNA-binding NarL/FixJ family response regulator